MTKPFLWSLVNRLSPDYRWQQARLRRWWAMDPEQAAADTRYRLWRYLHYCLRYSRFWQERWPDDSREFSVNEAEAVLRQLPVLTKADIWHHIDDLRIRPEDRRPRDGWPATSGQSSIQSGGSTGVPTRLWFDRRCQACSRATRDSLYALCGLRPGAPVFFIWGSPNELGELRASRRKRLASWLRGVQALPAFGLNEPRLETMRATMAAHRHVESAIIFASAAETLVEHAERRGVTFRRLRRVFLGGGMVSPQLRRKLQEYLADEVFDTYAARDFGLVAHETPEHDGLSVAEWDSRVEVLDAGGQPVADGGTGEVHVTQLNNHACAVIRMATGDIATWHAATSHRRLPVARLSALHGRTAERLTFSNGTVLDPSAVIHIVAVILAPPWLRKFQFAQTGGDAFELRIVSWEPAVAPEEVASLGRQTAAHLSEIAGHAAQVTVRLLDEIPLLPSGKHLQCVKLPFE